MLAGSKAKLQERSILEVWEEEHIVSLARVRYERAVEEFDQSGNDPESIDLLVNDAIYDCCSAAFLRAKDSDWIRLASDQELLEVVISNYTAVAEELLSRFFDEGYSAADYDQIVIRATSKVTSEIENKAQFEQNNTHAKKVYSNEAKRSSMDSPAMLSSPPARAVSQSSAQQHSGPPLLPLKPTPAKQSSAFASGFSGCFGVLAAIVVVIVIAVGYIGAAVSNSDESSSNGSGAPSPATQPRVEVASITCMGENFNASKDGWAIKVSSARMQDTIVSLPLGVQVPIPNVKQGRFLVVTVVMTNTGSTSHALGANRFTLHDGQNRRFGSDAFTEPDLLGDLTRGRDVNPGLSLSGELAYQVPPDDTGLWLETVGGGHIEIGSTVGGNVVTQCSKSPQQAQPQAQAVQPTPSMSNSQSAVEVVSQYYAALNQKDFSKAYGYLSSRVQASISLINWQSSYQNLAKVTLNRPQSVDNASNEVAVDFQSTDQVNGNLSSKHFVGTWTMVQEASGWKLDKAQIQEIVAQRPNLGIPPPPPTAQTNKLYVVVLGDTLATICNKPKPALMSVSECVDRVVTLNRLSSPSEISIGQTILVPQ